MQCKYLKNISSGARKLARHPRNAMEYHMKEQIKLHAREIGDGQIGHFSFKKKKIYAQSSYLCIQIYVQKQE